MTTTPKAGILALLIATLLLQGCYYTQAARGHMQLMRERLPVAEVLQSADTPEELKQRLQLLQEARDFAVEVLLLPDNDSYRSYAHLDREYVLWNVFAAPEFSLQAKTWCYPVAGCVAYRGYFQKEDADRQASKLADKGYDVAIGGVAAYSTLGRFADPLLSTMMRRDDTELVALLFHELAHQLLYVKGDSGFNESFATAVEEFGVIRWLQARGDEQNIDDYFERRELRQELMQMVTLARADLGSYYAETIDADEKRLLKQHRLELLQQDVAAVLQRQGQEQTGWFAGTLNNARLLSMILYEGRLQEFRDLLATCNNELECFYAAAEDLATR
ncbi:MAG: aminopeptidase [Woeseiaceae bacterium]